MACIKRVLLASICIFPMTAYCDSSLDKCRYHFTRGQYDLAVQPCTRVAEQGDLNAQKWLGLIFTKGKGVPQDYTKAFKWKSLAAAQGDAVGQYTLGRMYQQGFGVEQNYDEAIIWYRKSAAQGNVDGQYSLASMYKSGWGVERDYIQAWAWYSLAADQGMYLAGEQQDKLERELTGDQLERAKQFAGELKAEIYK